MVLISLHPFVPKRVLALIAAVVALLTVTALAAEPVLVPVATTPYDHQMSRVSTLLHAAPAQSSEPSMALVNRWMQELHAIPYLFSREWLLPEELTTQPGADCKGKAVALYHEMRAHGVCNLRLVVGQRTPTSRTTHVWVEWETPIGDFLLDPTFYTSPRLKQTVAPDSYRALFAYSGELKYRANT